MKKLVIVTLCLFLISTFGFSNAFAGSAKQTASVVNLREAPFSSPENWYKVYNGFIHTSNDKELIADVSFEIGLITDTTVYSKQLQRATAKAHAQVDILVVMNPGYTQDGAGKWIWDRTGRVALPGTSIVNNEVIVDGVTYAIREQTLIAKLAGSLPLVCDEDEESDNYGDCYVKDTFTADEIEEEMIRLVLDTMSAHSFNFVLPNCPQGTHEIGVFARLTYNDHDGTELDKEIDPVEDYGWSKAYLGKGSVTIEEVRMVKTNDFEL